MIQYALFTRLIIKPDEERAVADFLPAGLQMASQETTTPIRLTPCLVPNVFGIFDAFTSEEGRQSHLDGPIAKALTANMAELLTPPSEIVSVEVLGLKSTSAT